MPFQWDTKRFQKAAQLYKSDIDTLLEAMTDQKPLSPCTTTLQLESSLATALGRAIRYFQLLLWPSLD